MECPECNNEMQQLCMYGTNEDINIDYHCDKCGTLASLKWKQGKRKVAEKNSEIPF
jgi:transcription elongation factor Elf1